MRHIKKITSSFIFIMLQLLVFAQADYSLQASNEPLVENIHLHLNKTTFFKGEHLWFQAYVQDQINGVPSEITTNLHVGIFSEKGEAITQKEYLVSNGVAHGDFTIDSTFVNQNYTLMAWTNYMKNFEDATPFIQKIAIVGGETKKSSAANQTLTMLVFPEGQHLIENSFNSVGLLVYDQSFQPVILDDIQLISNDSEIVLSNIKTNELGQARFGFFAKPDQLYTLKVKDPSGEVITQQIPNQHINAIGISVDNSAEKSIVIQHKRSKDYQISGEKEALKLVIYNNSESSSFIQDYNLSEDVNAISINRYDLPSGINTAFLVDKDNKVLSQRMFYNTHVSNKRVHDLELMYCLTEGKDSLQIDVILPEEHETAVLSLSALPTATKAYKPNNSISSSLLVQPFVDEQLVNGSLFFNSQERSLAYQLDTRLLMIASENNELPSIAEVNENMPFKNEYYVDFKGKIIDADLEREKQVSVMSKTTGSINFFELTSNKDFSGNLPLYKGDSLLVSILNTKGALREPKVKVYFEERNDTFFDYGKWLDRTTELVSDPATFDEVDDNLNLSDGTIILEEVLLSKKVKTTKFQISSEIEGRIIDKEAIKRYSSLLGYLRTLGFQFRSTDFYGELGVYVFSPPGLVRVPVSINGMISSPGQLMGMPLAAVETIVYNKFPRPHQGPFISLTIRNDFDDLLGIEKFAKYPVEGGFDRSQSYFNPSYPNYSSRLYQHYGAIWWESQIEAKSDYPTSVIIPLNEQKEVKVLIEGMSTNGYLYQTSIICNPHQLKEDTD